jgi:hypothetical protein
MHQKTVYKRDDILMDRCNIGWVLFFAVIFPSMTFAVEEKKETLNVSLLKTPPVIDGNDGDAAWAGVSPIMLSHRWCGGAQTATQVTTQVKIGRTDRDLYVLFICDEPEPNKLARQYRERDSEVWKDDCVEIFMAPSSMWPGDFYHFVVNTINTQTDLAVSSYLSWNSQFRSAVCVKEKSWIVEIAIPFKDLNITPILNDEWKINFARERWAVSPFEFTSWQKTEDFNDPQCMGNMQLTGLASCPEIQKQSADLIAEKAKEVLAKLRSEIPNDSKASPEFQEISNALKTWQVRFNASNDLSERWAMVQQVKKTFDARIDQARLNAAKKNYLVTALSPMVNVRSNQLPSQEDSNRSSFSLHGARGEGESGQVLITAVKSLEKVTVSAQPLKGPGGSSIAPELFMASYIPIKKPTFPPAGFGIAGDYPDPLVPLKVFDMKPKTSQSIFFNLWIPANVPAGDYVGNILVTTANAGSTTVALKLRVYDVNLPKQSYLKNDMQIWNFLTSWYGDNYSGSMLERTRLLCLKYRCTSPEWMDLRTFITKNADGTFTANWTSFDQAVQYWFDQGATIFRLQDLFVCQKYNMPANAQESSDMGARLKLVEEHLQAKGWLDRCYFYIFDEPSKENIPQIKEVCHLIHQYAPKLHIILVYNSGLKNDAPAELIGYTQPWVPATAVFNKSFLSQRQAAGEEVWCYTCGSPEGPYPNGIDQSGTTARAMGWWCWQYKCQGYLYWCMDYWTSDPWVNPQLCMSTNGDGYLLWPDPAKKQDPFPSIRLLCTRDGFEDYDLMYMLRARVNEIKSKSALYQSQKTLVDSAQPLLDTSAVISSKKAYSQNPKVYERRHQALLEKLEALKLNSR